MMGVMAGERAPARLSAPLEEDSMSPDKTHLLVVDDCQPIRTFVVQLLQSMGFGAIDEARDGHDALALFRRKPYDVVISDWQMPRVSGLELLRAIRGGGERAETPVLMLTGDITAARCREAIDAGANGVLAKPFRATELCEKLSRVVSSLPPVTATE